MKTPFDSGSKPVAACALRIDRKESGNPELSLYFLHPNEAEFFSNALDLESQFDPNKVKEECDMLLTRYAEIYLQRVEDAVNQGRPLDEFISNQPNYEGPKTKQAIIKAFLEIIHLNAQGDRLAKVLNSLLPSLGSREAMCQKETDSRIKNENIPVKKSYDGFRCKDFLWKQGLGYNDALALFGKKDFNIVLVDPQAGTLNAGKFSAELESVKSSQAYIELMAQAKFYNGILNNYTSAEQDYLKKWIGKKGVEQMLQLLLNNILRARPQDQELFKTSLMHKIFTNAL